MPIQQVPFSFFLSVSRPDDRLYTTLITTETPVDRRIFIQDFGWDPHWGGAVDPRDLDRLGASKRLTILLLFPFSGTPTLPSAAGLTPTGHPLRSYL